LELRSLGSGYEEAKESPGFEVSTCLDVQQANGKHQNTLDARTALSTDFRNAQTVIVFAQIAMANLRCLARQNAQATLPAFLKYLSTWRYIGYYLIHIRRR
jgi:hypothetical protein